MELLSIVIPAYNSESTIGPLVDRLFSLYGSDPLEVVIVDDGSRDGTRSVVAGLAETYAGRVTLVELARNFGEHNAVMAGLHQTTGDLAVVMDDDFQNPPEAVATLVAAIRERDLDVVYARYPRKMHAFWRNWGSWFTNLFVTLLVGKPYDLYLSSFKVMSRFAVDQVIRYTGPYPYVDGLLLQSMDRIDAVVTPHAPEARPSSYSLRRLLRLWLTTVTNFSVFPLRVAFMLGVFACLLGVAIVAQTFYERLTTPDVPLGYASLITVVLLFSGLILIVCGLIGEYVGRIFLNISGKPQFVVRHRIARAPQGLAAAQSTRKTRVGG